MPAFPIVDAHVHFWDPSRLAYPWLGEVGALRRPFLVEDFERARGAVAVEAMVFVECDTAPTQALDEVEFVTGLAQREPRIRGVVASLRVEDEGGLAGTLARLAQNPLVKGVRRLLQGESDPRFCLREEFVRGVRELAKHDLSFDLCVHHSQLEAAVELVRRCPDVRFVLDHIGKPDIRRHVIDPWRDHIHELGCLRNVSCKLSGLVTEADHERWTEDGLSPYIAHVLDSFGPARVMFGGDWPVATLACVYPRWVEVVEGAVSLFSPAEQRAVFADNATRFYRLNATT